MAECPVRLNMFYEEEDSDQPYLDIYFYLSLSGNNKTPYEILHKALSQRSRVGHVLTHITNELYSSGVIGVHNRKYTHISEIKLDKKLPLSPEEKNSLLREFSNTYFI